MKKIFILLLAGTFICQLVQAQSFGAKVGLNYSRHSGGVASGAPGLNISGLYNSNEKISVNVGFIYGFPIKYSYSTTAYALSSATNPYSIDIESEISVSFKTIYLNANYYFNDNESDFGAYAILGGGLILAKVSEKYLAKDNSGLYDIPEEVNETFSGFSINAGLGANYKLGPGSAFVEALICLPANKVGNSYIENPIPFHFGANLGYRLVFGQ